ncbi:MAG: hypothetical protein M1813_006073 [Trichoglossum hirsutum]|nr:MAG: hypothetical protein M1813_006073 [Trichoglossum hirsutum]
MAITRWEKTLEVIGLLGFSITALEALVSLIQFLLTKKPLAKANEDKAELAKEIHIIQRQLIRLKATSRVTDGYLKGVLESLEKTEKDLRATRQENVELKCQLTSQLVDLKPSERETLEAKLQLSEKRYLKELLAHC